MIVLITDGAESCGSIPAVFRRLREKGVVMKSYVIGMGMKKKISLLWVHGRIHEHRNPSEVDAILDLTLKVFNSRR